MDNKELDPKRIFILAVLIFLMFTGYQLYFFYFGKDHTTVQQLQNQQSKVLETFPSLLLGTTRESKPPQKIQTFDFPNFKVSISEEGGKLVSLLDKKYNKELITDLEKKLNIYPLEVFSGDPKLDFNLNFLPYEVTKEGNTILIKQDSLGIVKTLVYKDNHFDVKINFNRPLYISTGTRVKEDSFYTHEGPVFAIGRFINRLDAKDIEGREVIKGDITFAGEESRYYFKGFSGNINTAIIYKLDEHNTLTLVSYSKPLIFYAGAKEYARLKPLGLENIIDYGTLSIIVEPLFIFMYWIYHNLGSWVFSILALTLIIRVLVFPLTYKSTVAMSKLAQVAPKIQQLKEKYKDDPAKMQEEMIKLYSEVGFNPMSGCLPMVLQIPIFFALYKVITITVDISTSSFLWIPSLAYKDPYYVLPILMGVSMIAQQFITPSPDKQQNIIMYVSAALFTFLFASFPSALVLYWTFNNIISIGQNYLIKKFILKDTYSQPDKKTKKGVKK